MPKVSIIIPFNNVEDYIEQCLDSVLSQTLNDIEIILVNDASSDKSRKIVQRYTNKDSRIKIIDIKERKGQGFARNRAIEIATGEYIGFVDSDDFIEQEMFEELYKKAKTDDTDITMCQVREYDDINEYYITSDYYSLEPLISFGENVFSADETKEQILDINVALWNKIYKREYLNKIGEKFPEGYIYEDLPFFFGTYLPAKKINIVWKNLYSYRVNRKNSTMQQFNDKILDRLPMVSLTYEKFKNVGYLDSSKQRIQGWIINDLFHRYTLLKENYHKEFFFLMKRVFENLEIENIEDEYWKKVYHFEGYLLVMNNSFENFNQKVFNEYLDIHKIEDRLLSQVTNTEELDRRFGLVYQDISKVYKYSENIVGEAKNQIKQELNVDEKIFKVDEKIPPIYEEIQKNYEYTNQITIQTDEKISRVYEEITKNYEYTNKLSDNLKIEIKERIENLNNSLTNTLKERAKDLYNDIKDLSFVVHDNFVELSKEQEKIKEEYKNLIDTTSKLNEEKTSEKISTLNNKLDKITDVIEEQKKNNTAQISGLIKKIENNEHKNYEIISNLKDEFLSILSEREEEHKKDVQELKNQIKDLESTLREEMKSPIKKLVEKYQNKQVK